EFSTDADQAPTWHQDRLFRVRSLGCRDRTHPVRVQQPPDVGAAGGQGCGTVLAAAGVAGTDPYPRGDRAGPSVFAWSNRRVAAKKQPLLAMEVLGSKEESAVVAFLVAGSLTLAVGFLIPLYVQIGQGRTPLASAVAILPYAVAIAAAGVLSVRLYDRFSPRSLGVASFILIAIGLVVVAITVGNDWSTVAVILGLRPVGG